jgi:hypothetical protein
MVVTEIGMVPNTPIEYGQNKADQKIGKVFARRRSIRPAAMIYYVF